MWALWKSSRDLQEIVKRTLGCPEGPIRRLREKRKFKGVTQTPYVLENERNPMGCDIEIFKKSKSSHKVLIRFVIWACCGETTLLSRCPLDFQVERCVKI